MQKWSLVLSLLVLILGGCIQRPCTEIGCVDGLAINFDLEEGTSAEVVLKGEDAEDLLECGGIQTDCPNLEIFDAFTVAQIDVSLYRDSVLLTNYTQVITYETSRPNGPGCDPECHQASVTISD